MALGDSLVQNLNSAPGLISSVGNGINVANNLSSAISAGYASGNVAGALRMATSGLPAAGEAVGDILSAVASFGGDANANDWRVRLSLANWSSFRSSPVLKPLKDAGGLIFPYTPQISFDHKADYASESPTHSNFTQYFYKHSAVSSISITGKFTVQNDKDAGIYLSTVHLLSALVKMRFGNDEFAGAPPPVCRLNAYGLFGINNVPVVISNFRQELPDSVDYYTTSKTAEFALFGVTSVPTISTVSITCNPVYSRQEMMDFNIPDWLQSGSSSRGKGYL